MKNLNSMKYMIGNTFLLVIHFSYCGEKRKIYAKAANLNLTGSIKDRIAYFFISKAYQSGRLKPGNHIVEATSGNTGYF